MFHDTFVLRSFPPYPFPVQVKGATDFSNFDSFSRDLEIPPDETSGWDADF